MKNKLLFAILIFYFQISFAQKTETNVKFSQPLYLDLPGDLHVKKGYKELNSLNAFQSYHEYYYYRLAVEYAFSPIDNLGLEIEVPTNLFSKKEHTAEVENKIEALRIGGMYSLPKLRSKDVAISLGFVNDFELNNFENFGEPLFEGNAFNPFIVLAKVWNKKLTTLTYFGPNFHTVFHNKHTKTDVHINTTIGYQIGKKENYINLETNQVLYKSKLATILRPQARLYVGNKWSLGIGATIPTKQTNEGIGSFVRIIFNP